MLEWYLPLKFTHVTAVVASISLFVLRAVWMASGSEMLSRRWVRILPHVIDSVLLASAVALTLVIHQYPLANDWLTAKVVALVVYVALGTIGLKRGRSRRVRMTACVAAVAVFGYIVSVALAHDPWGFLAAL